MEIVYQVNVCPTVPQVIALFASSGIRRPVNDPARIEAMLTHANLIVTASEGGQLIGIARALTDFSYCCYLSDLAVAGPFQKQGIGQELIRRVQTEIGPQAALLLLAAPEAQAYYPHIGFQKVENGWFIPRAT